MWDPLVLGPRCRAPAAPVVVTTRCPPEGLCDYYPSYCTDRITAVILFSQHPVSSSKTIRLRVSCGTRQWRLTSKKRGGTAIREVGKILASDAKF